MRCHSCLQLGEVSSEENCSADNLLPERPAAKESSPCTSIDTGRSENQQWQEASERAIRNVVVVKFCHTQPFDGEAAGVSEATGFVVDAKRGYVLTNRHVAGPGPFWGSCIFHSQEEVSCYPLYIDPIHDFAFLKYDPQAIEHVSIDGLPLCPKEATVGLKVLVVGNDAAETISIISGMISRIDRNAPEYDGPYSDFNINYYQASMNLSGGISGSPAMGADGSVVGMVSGGLVTGGSICYLLPLSPARNALDHLRRGDTVPRGDIHCQFLATPFHECRQLGLQADWEKRFRKRFAYANGLLVANTVLSSGPACGKIMVGDILLEVNGNLMLSFACLEETFDTNIGNMIEMKLFRDGQVVNTHVCVADLCSVTPKRLVSVGELVCHDVSYVQAIKFGVPRNGVYISESAGPSLIGDGDSGWIIQKMGSQIIENLDSFIRVLHKVHQGDRILVTYAHLENLQLRRTDVLTLDAPGGFTLSALEVGTGTWKGRTTSLGYATQKAKPRGLSGKTRVLCNSRPTNVVSCLVYVESRSYIYIDGFPSMRRQGMGLVVDSKAGLVVVSRLVIPHKACYVTITLGSSHTVEGRCLFWHPHHCYVVVQFDASLVSEDVPSARLSGRRAVCGEEVQFVRFAKADQILHGEARVGPVTVGGPAIFKNYPSLRCRPINADIIGVDAPSEEKGAEGVLVASDGSVLAIWLPFLGGIMAPSILTKVSSIKNGAIPMAHILPAEFEGLPISVAQSMGLPEDIITGIYETESHHPRVYKVKRTICGLGNIPNPLLEGDVVVSMNGRFCTSWADFDINCSRKIQTVVLRGGLTKCLDLQTIVADDLETERCVEFCGAYIQRPHLPVRHALDRLPSEVYVTHIVPGSPADNYCLPAESFITMVNGSIVDDLHCFLRIVYEMRKDSADENFTLGVTTLAGATMKLGMRGSDSFPPFEWIPDGVNGNRLSRRQPVEVANSDLEQ